MHWKVAASPGKVCCMLPFKVTEEETQKVTASRAAAHDISAHAALLPQLSSAGIFPFVEEQRMPLQAFCGGKSVFAFLLAGFGTSQVAFRSTLHLQQSSLLPVHGMSAKGTSSRKKKKIPPFRTPCNVTTAHATSSVPVTNTTNRC